MSKKSKVKLQTTSEMLERYSTALSEVAATHQRGMIEWMSSIYRTKQASESMDRALEQQRLAIMRMIQMDSEKAAGDIMEKLGPYYGFNGLTITDLMQQLEVAASEPEEQQANKEVV